ncbi:Clp protease N-terminal domain-containing protein [Luteococcus sp. H138]|uniref:Clp protease N-terminal domain-containing protein n=1 Tax=unclassified Luteococcus TaxID=2639923 RepID=UPI00313E06EA
MKLFARARAHAPNDFATMMAAGREAELAGRGIASLDDLLVALLVTGGPAARVLAAHGATLPSLRSATRERDADDLASIGVDSSRVTQPSRRSLRDAWTSKRTVELDPVVQELLKDAPSERELLTAVLQHPTGGPAEALCRACVDVDAVLAHEPWPSEPTLGKAKPVPGLLDGTRESTSQLLRFVPVPFERVADVITDPALVAQWIAGPTAVAVADDVIRVDISRGPKTAVFEMRRSRLERTADRATVVWQQFWIEPEQTDPRGYYLQLTATAADGGTDLRKLQGVNGRGPLAAPARLFSRLMAQASSHTLVQALVEVASAEPTETGE